MSTHFAAIFSIFFNVFWYSAAFGAEWYKILKEIGLLAQNGLKWKVQAIRQPVFNCSKLTTETLEQGVKYVQFNNKDTRATPMASFWCLYC